MHTQEIADFLARTGWEDIPREAVDKAKVSVLDFLGVSLAGQEEAAAMAVCRYVRSHGSGGGSSVVGHAFTTSAPLAALANGTIGHSLDYDDYSLESGSHPTAAVLPAVLALAEQTGASGADALCAYILGVEVLSKVASRFWRRQYELGWHATSTFGSLGAAAGAARLLGLGATEVRHALGIAASYAGGLRQNFGTMTKPLHAGMASRNGVEAALLAREGVTAAPDALEGKHGFARVFSGGRETEGQVALSLGEPYSIVRPGLGLKPYPSCGATHCAVEAALHLRERYSVAPDDILTVQVETHPMLPEVARYHRPTSGMEARFSMEYCVARALRDGRLALRHFADESVNDPSVQGTVGRITFLHPPERGAREYNWGTGLRLALRDGAEVYHEVSIPKGDGARPLSWEDICAKFRDCVSSRLDESEAGQALTMVGGLDAEPHLGPLMAIVARHWSQPLGQHGR